MLYTVTFVDEESGEERAFATTSNHSNSYSAAIFITGIALAKYPEINGQLIPASQVEIFQYNKDECVLGVYGRFRVHAFPYVVNKEGYVEIKGFQIPEGGNPVVDEGAPTPDVPTAAYQNPEPPQMPQNPWTGGTRLDPRVVRPEVYYQGIPNQSQSGLWMANPSIPPQIWPMMGQSYPQPPRPNQQYSYRPFDGTISHNDEAFKKSNATVNEPGCVDTTDEFDVCVKHTRFTDDTFAATDTTTEPTATGDDI